VWKVIALTPGNNNNRYHIFVAMCDPACCELAVEVTRCVSQPASQSAVCAALSPSPISPSDLLHVARLTTHHVCVNAPRRRFVLQSSLQETVLTEGSFLGTLRLLFPANGGSVRSWGIVLTR
jgi:hypothetical protein